MIDKNKYPVLSKLIANGTVYISDQEYVGIASDNIEVEFGVVGYEANVERYLEARPLPEQW